MKNNYVIVIQLLQRFWKEETVYKMTVITKQLMQCFCETHWIKPEIAHFNHIFIVWYVHCGGVQSQIYKNESSLKYLLTCL